MEEGKIFNDAVAQFAQTSAADRSAFTQLIDINAYLQQDIAHVSSYNENLQQKRLALQNQMNMMNLVQNPEIPPVQSQLPPTTVHPT